MPAARAIIATGRNIDAWCTRCKLDLAHTIVAMVDGRPVRVVCNTCRSEHTYRPEKNAVQSAAAPKAATASKPLIAKIKVAGTSTHVSAREASSLRDRLASWETQVDPQSDSARNAPVYSPQVLLQTGGHVRHDKFGLGVVVSIPQPGKAQILFRDGEKTLIYGRPVL